MITTTKELPLSTYIRMMDEGTIKYLSQGKKYSPNKLMKAWENIEEELIELHLKYDDNFKKNIFKDIDEALDDYEYFINKDPVAEIRVKSRKPKKTDNTDFINMVWAVEEMRNMPIDKDKMTVDEFYKLYFSKVKQLKNRATK